MKLVLVLSALALSACSIFGGGAKPDPAVQDHCKATYKDQVACESEKNEAGANVCEWFTRSDGVNVCRAKR